jgi:hypothetical protein
MNKIIVVIACCSLFLVLKIQAQHCPFDGSSIVIIKVLNKKNTTDFILKEVDNPRADSCTYAEGLVEIPFKSMDSLYAENHWVKHYEKRYKMQRIKSKGNLYVKLGMASSDCMLKYGNNFRYVKRQFVLTYREKKTGKTQQIKIPESKIFKMCTTAGSWSRFEPIEIK